LHTKPYDDIPTGTPLTGASKAGGVGKNRWFSEAIPGFIACCERFDRQVYKYTLSCDRPGQVHGTSRW